MQKSDRGSNEGSSVARARGRPRAFDRHAALEHATRLFWSKGYEATSITDLTQAMGIGSPSLYAAFGSKEALYAEALHHYIEMNEVLAWAGFHSAATAREAVRSLLMDSAAALTGCLVENPRGCMVVLSSVDGAEHVALADMIRAARAVTFERLSTRLTQAVEDGEIPETTDLRALARFIQTVQNGMSILARDGANRAELEGVADVAMAGWDIRTAST